MVTNSSSTRLTLHTSHVLNNNFITKNDTPDGVPFFSVSTIGGVRLLAIFAGKDRDEAGRPLPWTVLPSVIAGNVSKIVRQRLPSDELEPSQTVSVAGLANPMLTA